MIFKIDNPLAKLHRGKKEKIQLAEIRNKIGNITSGLQKTKGLERNAINNHITTNYAEKIMLF